MSTVSTYSWLMMHCVEAEAQSLRPPQIRGHNIYNFYVYVSTAAHTVSKPSFGSRGCTPSQRKRAPWLGIQQTISLRR